MPPRVRKTPAATVAVGGVETDTATIKSAIDVLTASSGIMVKQPLARAGNPLADCDYHAVANEQRQIDATPGAQTKPTFIRALERLAAEAGA